MYSGFMHAKLFNKSHLIGNLFVSIVAGSAAVAVHGE